MTDKIYKVVLLGKIAEGYDVEIAHEKLAIIFDIDLKKIPKLLKKPIVIRKNLTPAVAVKYKNGLEKIGVLCEIHPPLTRDFTLEESIHPSTDEISSFQAEEEAELSSITKLDNDKISPTKEPQNLSQLKPKSFVLSQETLRVINIKMSWWSLTKFSIKWILASIPAMIILAALIYLVTEVIKVVGLW
ncbi:hypothetical protein THII_3337 [Thioploca ingrica]|uniref:Uncharacterized protein n=1 Tax=Thioploca ingrica TaxID=40754 RepID=A0A090AJJ1_9GAMM|nr:hypothetical protein THII_3337 [Thioploca ingrica]